MRQLILLRHAETEPRAPSGLDLDRALTPQGRRDAAQAGAELAAAGVAPDKVLVSAARRAQETWSAAAPALGGRSGEVREALYDASADELLSAAETCGAGTVVLVAHNPGVAELASRLAGEPARFPPAAFAVLTWEEAGPRLSLRWAPA